MFNFAYFFLIKLGFIAALKESKENKKTKEEKRSFPKIQKPSKTLIEIKILRINGRRRNLFAGDQL